MARSATGTSAPTSSPSRPCSVFPSTCTTFPGPTYTGPRFGPGSGTSHRAPISGLVRPTVHSILDKRGCAALGDPEPLPNPFLPMNSDPETSTGVQEESLGSLIFRAYIAE